VNDDGKSDGAGRFSAVARVCDTAPGCQQARTVKSPLSTTSTPTASADENGCGTLVRAASVVAASSRHAAATVVCKEICILIVRL
jgi:hypothetical protein